MRQFVYEVEDEVREYFRHTDNNFDSKMVYRKQHLVRISTKIPKFWAAELAFKKAVILSIIRLALYNNYFYFIIKSFSVWSNKNINYLSCFSDSNNQRLLLGDSGIINVPTKSISRVYQIVGSNLKQLRLDQKKYSLLYISIFLYFLKNWKFIPSKLLISSTLRGLHERRSHFKMSHFTSFYNIF